MTGKRASYSLARTVDLSYEDADRRVRAELQNEGFGVLTEIDLKATLKRKLDVDIPSWEILGACAPQLARQALEVEPEIGLLLPCNVVVRESGVDGKTLVEALDPVIQLEVARNERLQPIAHEVRGRLERVLDRVAGA